MKNYILILLLALIMCGCGKEDVILLSDSSEEIFLEDEMVLENEEPESDSIYVQINGCVEKPGVYEMHQGARVFELIELAGGFTEDACETINQVSILSDSELIYVYSQSEQEKILEEEQALQSGLVDINRASASELTSLPGIGEAKANQIISYRNDNGPFKTPEDLLNVTGIGEGIFSKLKDFIIVR